MIDTANASLPDVILNYISRILNREYTISKTFTINSSSTDQQLNDALLAVNNDFSVVSPNAGSMDLSISQSPLTGIVKVEWARRTGVYVYTYPVQSCYLTWDMWSGSNYYCETTQQSCKVSAEADYSIYRNANGKREYIGYLQNGSLSFSGWIMNYIKGNKRVAFYDDVNDLAGMSNPNVTYEVVANLKKYTDWCTTIFNNDYSRNAIELQPSPAAWLPSVLHTILR